MGFNREALEKKREKRVSHLLESYILDPTGDTKPSAELGFIQESSLVKREKEKRLRPMYKDVYLMRAYAKRLECQLLLSEASLLARCYKLTNHTMIHLFIQTTSGHCETQRFNLRAL